MKIIDSENKLYMPLLKILNASDTPSITINKSKDGDDNALITMDNEINLKQSRINIDDLEMTFGEDWDKITVTKEEDVITANAEKYTQDELKLIDEIDNDRRSYN